MATRTQAREAVIQLLYACEMGCDSMEKLSEIVLDDFKLKDKHGEFAMSLYHGVLEREKILVQVMASFLKSWDITRLGVVEKCVLMLGIYELLESNLDNAVVINEAIELTRTFNVGDAAKLVNGVLDSISKKSADEIADMIESTSKIKSIDTRLFIEIVSDERTKKVEKSHSKKPYKARDRKDSKNTRDSKKDKLHKKKNSRDSNNTQKIKKGFMKNKKT
ncbi:transcription antitermination factor NusB [Helicobacter saguini]|uniref:Transcription antitermination protein NusB n=1 Tax=Helicobacter saguini TaxID=1548018 RepID=A0A6L7DA37_9HELI|nr:transcription antitermination factor NusB [Helicobacter saguini]MWV61639.1 transcription antitermination factor NusB [Helicobacter saguini]MWV70041.1 transcription antitermination factor NusB [Helicobacter saguini]MWV72746.1 transcription antitermination factor NusB [Helicobacter saguini]